LKTIRPVAGVAMELAPRSTRGISNPLLLLFISNAALAFTGNISFYYQDGELNGLSEHDLTLNVHNGTGWKAYINNVIRNSTNNLVTTTLSGVTLNELTLASFAHGPLPMVWLDIAAQRRNGSVQISWQTADETNCDGYQVEKSNNGVNWSKLGNAIKAYNTPGPNHYNLPDPSGPAAISFYRIRQHDLDGSYTYSKIVSVKSEQSNSVWLYPIPANDLLTIVAGGNLQLKAVTVYSTAGSLVASAQPQQVASLTLNIQHLPAGNYTAIIILSDNSTIAKNFIKK
jgi:hypothetical protein